MDYDINEPMCLLAIALTGVTYIGMILYLLDVYLSV